MMFRGRELQHIDIGLERLREAIKDLAGVESRADDEPKRRAVSSP